MFWWFEEGKLVKITFRIRFFFVLTMLNVRNVLNYNCSVLTLLVVDRRIRFFNRNLLLEINGCRHGLPLRVFQPFVRALALPPFLVN